MQDDVHEWFHSNTLNSEQFDRRDLAAAKSGTSVSVVLPARAEAATVGVIVEALRRELHVQTPLVDELVVVDSGSQDDTIAVARAAGAAVVRQSDVLDHLGDRPGKGEALWKSLQVTSGDVVAFEAWCRSTSATASTATAATRRSAGWPLRCTSLCCRRSVATDACC